MKPGPKNGYKQSPEHIEKRNTNENKDKPWPPAGIDWYYSDGSTAIALGDCRLILPHLEPVDLVLTDPPYGIGIASKNLGQGRSTGIESTKMIYGDWDRERAGTAIFRLIEEKAKHAIIWGGNYYADVLPASQCWLVWDKRDGLPQRSYADCELAWTSFDKATRLMASRWDGFIREGGEARNGHPTQKPLELIKWAIEQAPPECMTILDPFMGSGTTLVAARDLGRRAIGVEIERKYCDIAIERLRQRALPLSVEERPAHAEQEGLYGTSAK